MDKNAVKHALFNYIKSGCDIECANKLDHLYAMATIRQLAICVIKINPQFTSGQLSIKFGISIKYAEKIKTMANKASNCQKQHITSS